VPGIGGTDVSIVRVGLAETKGFADGYEAIFGSKSKKEGPAGAQAAKGKKKPTKKAAAPKAARKKPTARKAKKK
jgi:hypothetical protein